MAVAKSRIREELLKLLKEDEEFRYAVAGLLGLEEVLRRIDRNTEAIAKLQEQVAKLQEHVAGLQEQVAKLQEQMGRLQEQMNRLQEQMNKLQEQVAEHSKVLRSLQEQLIKHSEAIEKLASSIQAVGMRYGVFTEEAFREGIKYLVRDLLKEYKVDKWVYYDKEGLVYGHPSIIEVDILVRDEERILVEYKSMVDRSDVAELYRIGKLFEKVEGAKPRLLIVSPAIRKRAKELAEKLGIELRGNVIDI